MKPRTYATPAAFKAALDERLRKVAETGADITRRRQLLVFDRYLARLTRVLGDAATLKGGLVLEVRLERARTTRDIDLRLAGSPGGLLGRLQRRAAWTSPTSWPSRYGSTRDILTSLVRASSTKDSASGPSAGWRECSMARLSGSTWPLAIRYLASQTSCAATTSSPSPASSPPIMRLYPVETHLAEKLHAYTLPRPTPSTRVKDLPDLALLGQVGERDVALLRAAIEQTFAYRGTHAVPAQLPDPPASWEHPYAEMAGEDSLPWPTLLAVTEAARAFIDPVLTRSGPGRWYPRRWAWV